MKPKLAEWHIYGNEQQGRFTVRKPDAEPLYYLDALTNDVTNQNFFRILDKKQYELKDHLGNVRVAIGDMKIPTAVRGVAPFVVDEKAVNDYYPYGMLISDRSWSSGSSRYGYNGKEMDNELKGTGNSLDFGERIFDPRKARFDTQDKLKNKFANQSSYVYAGDNPILNIDVKGMYLKGINGKKTTYNINEGGVIKWNNATNDIIEVGNAMLRNNTGKKVLDGMIKTSYPIEVIISDEKIKNNGRLAQTDFTTYTNNDGRIIVADAKITIFKDYILDEAKEIQECKSSSVGYQGKLYDYYYNLFDIEAIIGANGTHEGIHTTKKNILITIQDPDAKNKEKEHDDLPQEKEPEKMETKFLEEELNKIEEKK